MIYITNFVNDNVYTKFGLNRSISFQDIEQLELMFMKHYAPNRCLYIKVAKLRTGVGSAEMSHLQNRCLTKYQGRCEQRSEVFVKTFFFFFFFFWGGGVRSGGGEGVGVTGWM